MGGFDSVRIHCPWCRRFTVLQSKAGSCLGATYRSTEVPLRIAGDLAEDRHTCDRCEQPFVVKTTPYNKVMLRALPSQMDADQDDYDVNFTQDDVERWRIETNRSTTVRTQAQDAIRDHACPVCAAPREQRCQEGERTVDVADTHVARLHAGEPS